MIMRVKFSYKMPTKVSAVCASVSKAFILSAALAIPLHSQAGIESDMAGMFNSMGVESNYTKGGAFHGQSGSLYTGGSLSVRAPASDITPANIRLPTINAGCGGIDIFGGSFSFVNKEQFIQFTRNLGNNAAGVAFDLALKALDPMIQDAIGGIRDLVNKINQGNLNSCQMAQSLVGGVMGAVGESMGSNCKASAVSSGTTDDASGSSWYCQFADNLVNETNKIRGTGTPQDTIGFTGGNLTYEALKNSIKSSSLKGLEMDFYYSLLGTAVFIPPENKGGDKLQAGIQVFMPTVTSAEDILKGKKPQLNAGNVILDMLSCQDGSKKLKELCSIKKDVPMPSIMKKIKDRLSVMAIKIQTDTGWSADEIRDISALAANTRLPILRMGISDAFLGTNNLQKDAVIEAIAIDFIAGILDQYDRRLRASLGLFSKLDEQGERERTRLFDNLTQLRTKVFTERRVAMQKIEVEFTMLKAISEFNDQWRTAFGEMGYSMDFDNANRI